jgi:hypothetical protein
MHVRSSSPPLFTNGTVLSATLVAVCGYVAFSHGHVWTIPLSLFLPLVLGRTRSRLEAFLLAACYFGGVWSPIIRGARVFYGHQTYFGGVVTWGLAMLLCAAPFGCLWARGGYRPLLVAIAVLVHALLPIGLGSPLLAAGVLFPQTMWLGLTGTLALCGFVAWRDRRAQAVTLLAVLVAVVSNLRHHVSAPVVDWQVINTHQGGSGFLPGSPLGQWTALRSMFASAKSSSAKVILFPETTIPYWSDDLTGFFQSDLAALRAEGKTVVFGTEVDAGVPHMYDNVMLARGHEQASYVQRIPMPVSMWGRDVEAHPWGTGVLNVDGRRAAVLLCYEQLLTLPALESFWEHPDLLIAASNLYWAEGTTIPASERICLESWSRLFSVPLLHAINT